MDWSEAYLACPPLSELWPAPGDGTRVGAWIRPRDRTWTPPKTIRRFIDPWSKVPAGPLDLVIVLGPLDDHDPLEGAPAWLGRLRSGGQIHEITTPRRLRALQWLWPGRLTIRSVDGAVARARRWLEVGLVEVQQWAPVDPESVLLTMGRLRAFDGLVPRSP